jgi:superfamily II DNA or RNA helicase
MSRTISMISLRTWQTECIGLAIDKYANAQPHFLCLATPGAGKTVMAAVLAKSLLETDKIDLVICFSPSLMVCDDFRNTLTNIVGLSFDGRLGAVGECLCYHSMQFLGSDFWDLFKHKRVFAIFDEIHHCAGQSLDDANSWGQQILANIQGKAAYTLAMTGTPWRSDDIPIVLATYCENSSRIQCDFQYGIKDATDDGVCRLPSIVAVDNDTVVVSDSINTKRFTSFSDALTLSGCSYKNIIEHPDIIDHLLNLSVKQLRELKDEYSDSAGLIVAASVEHANHLINLLFEMKQTAVLVTYREKKPLDVIRDFRHGKCDWIVSVGMISEGTNIPRLRVCCYLSHVKTELYFRQVLGRVLRVQNHKHEVGYFFMPAHPKLIEYAQRVREDIPEGIFETLCLSSSINIENEDKEKADMVCKPNSETNSDYQLTTQGPFVTVPEKRVGNPDSLDHRYNFSIDSIGRFREAIFQL